MLVDKYDAYISARSSMNRTPCHIASLRNNVECVKVLLDNKCDINAIDDDGNTPLHIASESNASKCVDYLLRNSVDCTIKNNVGKTAIDLSSNVDIKYLFMKYGSNDKKYSVNNFETKNDTIDNSETYNKRSQFHRVLIKNARTDVVQKLLYRVTNPNQAFQNIAGPINNDLRENDNKLEKSNNSTKK